MTSFVLLATVLIELVITIESLTTKAAFWMTPETALINGSRMVITELCMPPKLPKGKELMLMGEDFLVASTKITHQLAMLLFDMVMEMRPSQACDIAVSIGTVVPQKKDGVFEDDIFLILDPEGSVRSYKVRHGKLFVFLRSIVGEYHIRCFSLYLLAAFLRATRKYCLPCNTRSHAFYTKPSALTRRCGMSDGYKAQLTNVR